jgi:N-acetylmuramoyl-L-alanine amidase
LLAAVTAAGVFAASAHASPPVVGAAASPASGGVPLTATLTATGDPATYHWDFGDGASADGGVVRHTWTRAGRYVVNVVAVGPTGEAAAAQVVVSAYSVRLTAPGSARYGAAVTLRGRVVPAVAGRAAIRAGARIVSEPRIHPGGRFQVVTALRRPGPWTAAVAGARSRPVSIVVKPKLTVSVDGPPVAGAQLVVHAHLRPAAAGRLSLAVSRAGRLSAHRTFTGAARLPVATDRPEQVRVVLTAQPAVGYAPVSKTVSFTVRATELEAGARGAAVKYLQQRLLALHYALRGVSGSFGDDTSEAVIAFQKTVGLPRTGQVDEAVWRALARARVPSPRVFSGTHIEVDKERQLLFQVARGSVTRIIGVSTGATGNTPVGSWHVYRKVPGWDWVLWYPLYFLRGFAVHGYPYVPPFPASHGCVRIPMWLAPSLYATYGYGTLVVIY